MKSARESIGLGQSRIPGPKEVGEIDYIGYSATERLLVVAECKLVRDSTESKLFRDDLEDFVNSPNSYIEQLRRKYEWVRTELPAVCEALASAYPGKTVEPQNTASILVTFLPTIASCFIEDVPCVSITEIRLDYEAKGKWAYGLQPCTFDPN